MNIRFVSALGVMSLWLAASLAGAARASVVADFTNGNDDVTHVDAYHGVPGDGWKSPWVENQILTSGDSLLATNLVSNANPIAGGGNYLGSSVTTSVSAGASASYATSRDFSDGIDLSIPYRIEFTVRIDEDVSLGFDEYHDRYVLCDGDATTAGTSSVNSWSILAHGAAGAAAHAGVVGHWAFYNGSNNGTYLGTDPARLLDTGIAVITGSVYSFTVTVDPNQKTWSGTVSDGIDTYSQSDMGWRTSASLGKPYLVFGTKADAGDETRAWSIDAVTITQVPGPPPVYRDTVAARFDAGETEAEVDGYPGMAGLGWDGAWRHTTSNADVTGTVAVLSLNPLKPSADSGNYAQVTNAHNADKTYSGFCRDYKMLDGGIDSTKKHTIQFSIRIDEDLTAGNFTVQDDRYHISNVSGTKNTDTTASWMVTLVGGEGTYANADDVGEWIFYDGNRDSGAMDVTRTVSSDIVVVSGTVYDFTIVVDPETQSYIGSVTDGTHTFTSGTLGWRRSSSEIGENLMFDTRAGGITIGPDQRQFSVENSSVSGGGTLTDSTQVLDVNPIHGGGNYLSSTVVTTNVGTSAQYSTGRDFTGGIDISLPFRISFTVRIDEDMGTGTTFDKYHDRYTLSDGSASVSATGSSNSWSILAHGGTGAHAHAGVVGQWAVYDGDNNGSYNGSDPTKLIATGIALTTGGVYDFSITVDPTATARTWSCTISDGTHTFSRSDMGWRKSGDLNTFLHFSTKADSGNDTRAWSIDSVSVVNVPEPGSFALLAVGLATLVVCRARRWSR